MHLSVDSLLNILDELIDLHDEMLENSKFKTTALKEGEVDALQKTLLKEQKLVRLLESAEQKRISETELWFAKNKVMAEEKTVTNMLTSLNNELERERLAEAITRLTNAITNLKAQEQLNHSLLQQSLQFIQFSLNMVNPSIENFNYGTNNNSITHKKSIFDSKA